MLFLSAKALCGWDTQVSLVVLDGQDYNGDIWYKEILERGER